MDGWSVVVVYFSCHITVKSHTLVDSFARLAPVVTLRQQLLIDNLFRFVILSYFRLVLDDG